jgi:hypothetical protein
MRPDPGPSNLITFDKAGPSSRPMSAVSPIYLNARKLILSDNDQRLSTGDLLGGSVEVMRGKVDYSRRS